VRTVRVGAGLAAVGLRLILQADALRGYARYGHAMAGDYLAGDYLAAEPSRGHLAAAFHERRWSASVVLAACAALTMIFLAAAPFPHARGPRLFVALLLCGTIAALRRWPLPVLAVAAAVSGLAMALGNIPVPIGVVLGLAVFFVASRMPRRSSIPAAVVTAAVLGATLLYAALAGRTVSPGLESVEGFVPLVAAWFVGDSVAARRRYLAGLAEQAERERAAEAERARQQIREERVRIARELHDVVAHTLAVITVQAGVGRRLAARRPEQANAALESIETIGRTAQDELRVVLGLLREEETGTAPLAPAPRLADVPGLVGAVRASGTLVELRMSGADGQLSPALELSVYRVIQEALTNVVKHAPGARAAIDLAVSSQRVRLEITDDGGPGERPPAALGAGHGIAGHGIAGHGIAGMRERIAAFGGWLAAAPRAERGFCVVAEIPVERAM
jgi:signal transduction histidine kinase